MEDDRVREVCLIKAGKGLGVAMEVGIEKLSGTKKLSYGKEGVVLRSTEEKKGG